MQNCEKLRNENTKLSLLSRKSDESFSSGNQQFELEFGCVDVIPCLGFESRVSGVPSLQDLNDICQRALEPDLPARPVLTSPQLFRWSSM